MEYESGMSSGRSRACAPTAPRPRGCWRFPVLRAGARPRGESGRLSGIRASRRTRPLLRMLLAAWIGIQRENGFVWPTGSCCVSMSRRAAAGARHLWPRRRAAACGRTSEHPMRTDASVRRDPRAASRDVEQLQCHAERGANAEVRPLRIALSALCPYFSTFNFPLFHFPGGRHA